MKIKNQAGVTLVELLLAIVILGFIVTGFLLLSSSIVKTNTSSYRESQSMAYATIISELIKDEYTKNTSSIIEGSTLLLESRVIDEDSMPDLNPNFSIRQSIDIPKVGESTGYETISYMSGKETEYQYKIQSNLINEYKNSSGKKNKQIKITVNVENIVSKKDETIIFFHYFENV